MSKEKEEKDHTRGKVREKNTMEKDTRETGKAKDTKGKEKENATIAARPDIYQETAFNREREKASHSRDGATTVRSKGTWQEIAGVEKEE